MRRGFALYDLLAYVNFYIEKSAGNATDSNLPHNALIRADVALIDNILYVCRYLACRLRG